MDPYQQAYQRWKTRLDRPDLLKELSAIENNIDEIQDSFYKNLGFGTGGMRGLMGVGPNRMNIYTVRKATQGLANYLHKASTDQNKKVIIAYDSRYKSKDFAVEAALVLAHNNITTYVFKKIMPTPLLSFAVRALKAQAGIVITASHNPKEYNGYKVYNGHGGQITNKAAQGIMTEITSIEDIFEIKTAEQKEAEAKNLLVWIDEEILAEYLSETKKIILRPDLLTYASDLNIVYSPLHGTGLEPIKRLLQETGFSNLHVVQEQAVADPAFPTLICPNPEEAAACCLALEMGGKINADLILVTDPDADRIGVSVKNELGQIISLTGNQTGALLIDYILHSKKAKGTLPENGIIIKTIVTSHLGATIAAKYGINYEEVLTGFKYIGEKIEEHAQRKDYTFLFGYEESYGYLISDHVRDKDAIQTCLILSEMALFYKRKGLTLCQRLQELFTEYGFYQEDLVNIHLAGVAGQKQIQAIMENLRLNSPEKIGTLRIIYSKDYFQGIEKDLLTGQDKSLTLPKSNVLYYSLENGAWCCIRPSGTEPKLKVYIGVKEATAKKAKDSLEALKKALLALINV